MEERGDPGSTRIGTKRQLGFIRPRENLLARKPQPVGSPMLSLLLFPSFFHFFLFLHFFLFPLIPFPSFSSFSVSLFSSCHFDLSAFLSFFITPFLYFFLLFLHFSFHFFLLNSVFFLYPLD